MIKERIEEASKEKSEIIGWILTNKYLEGTFMYQSVLLRLSIIDLGIELLKPLLVLDGLLND